MVSKRSPGTETRSSPPNPGSNAPEPDDATLPDVRQFPAAIEAGEVTRLCVGNEELWVLSAPLPRPSLPGDLSDAQREIAMAMLRGCSDAEIARERGTSPRTIAAQTQQLFRKLAVSSRAELARLAFSGSVAD